MAQRQWTVSRFTRVVKDEADGTAPVQLHNSFMGALGEIPAEHYRRLEAILGPAVAKNRAPDDLIPFAIPDGDALLEEMARQGFIVPVDLDEATRAGDLLEAERDYGLNLIILPHEDCNFRCTYCYETFERGKMAPAMVSAVKALASARIPSLPMLNVGWFGGEPCLARDVIETLSDHFIAECERADVRYRASITTNGYFLSDDLVGSLLRRGVGHFQVTIDGSEETHDMVRRLRGGQATYRRIFRNLVGMTTRDEDFSVAIRVNFTPQTVRHIEDFLAEAEPHFAGDDRFFLDFHPVGRWGGPNDRDMDVISEESAGDARLNLFEASTCRGFPATAPLDALKPHGTTCYAGKPSSMVIGSDGRIYKCTVAFEDPRNHVGRLHEDGRLEIDADKWRLWTEPVSTSGKCGTCSFFASCQSRACPLAAIEAAEPPCPFTPEDFARSVRFAAAALRAGAAAPKGRRYVTADAEARPEAEVRTHHAAPA